MPSGDVLVTGGSGHLGHHLIARLNARGITPRVLLRRGMPPDSWGGLRLVPEVGDLEAPAAVLRPILLRTLQGVEEVYHLAACTSLQPADARRARRVNVEGTLQLAHAARAQGIRRLVYVSTAATIGASPDGRPLDESASWNLDGLKIPYIESKREAERQLLESSRRLPGFPEVVVANPTLLVGPPRAPGRAGSVSLDEVFSKRPVFGWVHFYVDGRLNLVDVRDVAEALIHLMERGRSGERYLLAGPSLSVREVLDALSEHLPPPWIRVRLPRRLVTWAARIAAALDADDSGTDPNSPVPGAASLRVLLRLLDYGWSYSSEKARREIGFAPTPFRQSLREQFAWLR